MDVIPEVAEQQSACPCCGRAQYSSCGNVVAGDEIIAGYWYRWADGHEGRFALGIQWHHDTAGMRVATLDAHAGQDGLHYGLLEPGDSPFGDLSEFGAHIGRDDTLSQPDVAEFWRVVDAVAAREPALSGHIKAHYGLA